MDQQPADGKAGSGYSISLILPVLVLQVISSYCGLLNCAVVEEDNMQGWFFAEDDGNQMKKQKHPLLLRQMPVVMSKLQEFKVSS